MVGFFYRSKKRSYILRGDSIILFFCTLTYFCFLKIKQKKMNAVFNMVFKKKNNLFKKKKKIYVRKLFYIN